ncbi:hypothetical protein J0B02_00515 [Enterobacteriaceae bacterium YMB-R22]|uniref:hypothetical protein n=1 Tax=Tenebrionicola larvae TaxID=2815733 RepID=UPI00201182F7|nr:hypothetical protein [Tenebrionicola larvae]MBV4411341.1 hypothetical protein [Tenebrionicola larvae]
MTEQVFISMIIDKKSADIRMDGGGGILKIDADTKEARFIRISVMLALLQFKPFPVTIKQADDDAENKDDE